MRSEQFPRYRLYNVICAAKIRHLLQLFVFVFFALPGFSQFLPSGGALKPLQANMDIRHYRLNLAVDPDQQSFAGSVWISFILRAPSAEILLDLVSLYKVSKVLVDGKPCSFEHQGEALSIVTAAPMPAGRHRVDVFYAGKPPVAKRAPWDGGIQWERDSLGHHWIAMTCQTDGAKIFFPCKDHPSDEPDEGADLYITVPRDLVVAGPGLLQSRKQKGKQAVFHWKTRYSISNYCILFNVGDYTVVNRSYTTIKGRQVPMQFYVLRYHADKAPHHLELLERMARVQEKYFGEYPWVEEKIGIAETPHLGMEHQTMNAYGNKFRYTKVGGEDFDWLMHHEFGHEWWGNQVTNADWAHMWIQEGICVFGDAMYVREKEGEEAYLARMRQTARATRNEKPVVQGDVVDSKATYHPDIYGKGAFFMHTLRYVMGDSLFFPALLQLATAPAYTRAPSVTTRDVQELFSRACGMDLGPLFKLFLYSTDKLQISIRQMDEETYELKIPNAGMPLPLDLRTEKGISKLMIPVAGLQIKSRQLPEADPRGYYLKTVTLQ
jgi:aminopeptidase N